MCINDDCEYLLGYIHLLERIFIEKVLERLQTCCSEKKNVLKFEMTKMGLEIADFQFVN